MPVSAGVCVGWGLRLSVCQQEQEEEGGASGRGEEARSSQEQTLKALRSNPAGKGCVASQQYD